MWGTWWCSIARTSPMRADLAEQRPSASRVAMIKAALAAVGPSVRGLSTRLAVRQCLANRLTIMYGLILSICHSPAAGRGRSRCAERESAPAGQGRGSRVRADLSYVRPYIAWYYLIKHIDQPCTRVTQPEPVHRAAQSAPKRLQPGPTGSKDLLGRPTCTWPPARRVAVYA